MSYARFSYADVYVYLDCGGDLCCCGCWLGDEWHFQTTAAMLEHLEKHRAAGHNVPEETLDDLRADAQENDAWIAKVAAGMCPTCDGSGVCHNKGAHKPGEDCSTCHGTDKCWQCEGTGRTA